jgi:hypothetical protein
MVENGSEKRIQASLQILVVDLRDEDLTIKATASPIWPH